MRFRSISDLDEAPATPPRSLYIIPLPHSLKAADFVFYWKNFHALGHNMLNIKLIKRECKVNPRFEEIRILGGMEEWREINEGKIQMQKMKMRKRVDRKGRVWGRRRWKLGFSMWKITYTSSSMFSQSLLFYCLPVCLSLFSCWASCMQGLSPKLMSEQTNQGTWAALFLQFVGIFCFAFFFFFSNVQRVAWKARRAKGKEIEATNTDPTQSQAQYNSKVFYSKFGIKLHNPHN